MPAYRPRSAFLFRTNIRMSDPTSNSRAFLHAVIFAVLFSVACAQCTPPITENDFYREEFNPFVEPGFPFISTYLDARGLGARFPDDNVVSRGLIINLDDSAFICFDRDLLRWSVAWTGGRLTESMLPEVSYHDFFNKLSHVPEIAGDPAFGNGIYPGWSSGRPLQQDVRPVMQEMEGSHWGPLPAEYGRWDGVYVFGTQAILTYSISGTGIAELPGVIRRDGQAIFTRALEIDGSPDTLFMNAAEVRGGSGSFTDGAIGYIHFGEGKDSVVAMGIRESGLAGASVRVVDGRYLTVVLPPSVVTRKMMVALWHGSVGQLDGFRAALQSADAHVPACKACENGHWQEEVYTQGAIAPDTAAFVADILTLPIPNPWKRNVRVIDMAFLDKNTIVASTFEGDIWMAKGINGNLKNMSWKRFASGLYEPMSVEVRDGQIYVFGKEGIVRLHDLNGDGEADYYENFCDLMQVPPESYAWAADMVFSEKDNSFIIALGGAVNARPGITKPIMHGFRAGSNHSGTIMRISLDGKHAAVIATGFRMPFLGLNPLAGAITATDQQGNYVSSTPIFAIEDGMFYGVPATSHRSDAPVAEKPLTWIPHRVDRSAGGQIWMTSEKMGPLDGSLVHFSFGKPGLFRVLVDSTAQGLQGGVAPIPTKFYTPILKGVLGPVDGQLYMAGFNLLGSSAEGVSAIQRLRYTGKPSYMPNRLTIGKQGIIVSFDTSLDPAEVGNPENYRVKRWNYHQTEEYGSGHYKLDGTPGEEILPVLASYLSSDGQQVLLLVPDMRVTDQMEVMYQLKATDGTALDDGIWLSVNHVPGLDSRLGSFGQVELRKLDVDIAEIASLVKSEGPITRERGSQLFHTVGCVGCHSPGTETAGKYGPPFKGMYGTMREMNDGTRIEANDAYLRESILDPSKHIVKGYEAEMPSYVGVLSDADIKAIQLYIMYLKY